MQPRTAGYLHVRADPMEDEKRPVDFSIKKTENQWQRATDRFWLEATPKLFEWFRWVISLAALTYVAKKADNHVLQSLVGCANFAVLAYYFAYFSQFELRGLPFIKSRRVELLLSVLVSCAIAYLTYQLVNYSVNVLVSSQP